MIAYTRDEIISASEMARGISTILNDLKTKKKERYVISRNNRLLLKPSIINSLLKQCS